jgi:hypothetical protein
VKEAMLRTPNILHISSQSVTKKWNPGKAFAATSTTEEEEQITRRGNHPDGSAPVKVPKRAWRPKIKTVYEEPEDILDSSGELDWLFEENGKAMIENKTTLPQRSGLIIFEHDKDKNSKEINANLQWRDCPEKHHGVIREIIEKFFDVFAQDGMQRPIRGFEFNIDTGKTKPIFCKPPQYGHHERIIEDDDGPWGSPIVLASKPNQEHVHWSQFVFRLCVSYRAINGITRPFTFPVTRCNEAVD